MRSRSATIRSSWHRSWSARCLWSPATCSPTSRTRSPIRGSVFAEPWGLEALRARYRRLDRATRIALWVLVAFYLLAFLAPVIAPYSPSEQVDIVAMKNHPPTWAHPFGTDRFSRDELTRVLY